MRLGRWVGRTTATAFMVVTTIMVRASVALAQYPGGTQTPTPSPTTTVLGGQRTRGTATTGADILRYVLVAAVILLVGFALLRLTRSATAGED